MISWRFNATTSDISFGANASQAPLAQTVLALFYATGSGEGGTGYVMSRTPVSSVNGPRMSILDNTAAPQIFFGGHSTGNAGQPSFTGNANTITYGKWHHCAATWDGTLTGSTGVLAYVGIEGKALALVAGTTANGTTAADAGSANALHVGNRGGTDRTFNGDIAYVAQWNRVLSLDEMLRAQFQGPLSVKGGLTFFWDGQRDLAPYQLPPVSITDLALGFLPPPQFRPMVPKRVRLNSAAAATVFIRMVGDNFRLAGPGGLAG